MGKITTLIIYIYISIDDMMVTINDFKERNASQNSMAREFKMKNLGSLNYFFKLKYLDLKK